jgi:diguanylate cyclase (GGDEF)-like protein/PAS domain S-box-containing protein
MVWTMTLSIILSSCIFIVALMLLRLNYRENKRVLKELEFKSILLDKVYDSIFAMDNHGKFVYVNEAAYKTRGYKREELMDMTFRELDINSQQFYDANYSGPGCEDNNEDNRTYNTVHGGKDGIATSIEVHMSTVEFDGEPVRIAVARDVSECKLIEEALKESERQFRGLLENMQLLSVMLDFEGVITFCNDFLLESTGWDWLDLIGRNWFDIFVPEETRKQVRFGFKKAIDGKSKTTNSEYDILTASGERRTVSFSWSLLHDPHGNISGMAYIGEDITERKRAEAELNHMAYYDALTSLPNRAHFVERLNKAIIKADESEELLAILHFDLDGFKIINDSLGHEQGDKLLNFVADRLVCEVNDRCSAARFGGDKFALLLTGITDRDDVVAFAERIIDVFKTPFVIDEHELHVTVCMGINTYPGGGSDAHALLKNTEVALYRAKDRGRNAYQIYSSDLDNKALERLALENSLRKALGKQEFELHYQPQVSLTSGEIVGMEALLRWHSEEHGMVSPAVFIPIAEETGLILSIGEWVLWEACRQTKAWIEAGYAPIRMSVNLSARQFQHHNLVGMVDRILAETQLAPELLDLELTESTIMKDADKVIEILNEIKLRGIHISIDDFGTGYSSLGYLKRFPIDRLKIDRMFIDSVIKDENDAAIVSATIAMAKSLRMRSVAEGVETVEQLSFLQSLGCNEMQGFLFSKPLPVTDATAALNHPPNHLDDYWQAKDSRVA